MDNNVTVSERYGCGEYIEHEGKVVYTTKGGKQDVEFVNSSGIKRKIRFDEKGKEYPHDFFSKYHLAKGE